MEEKIITFTANEQGLVKTGGISHYASDTISYIKAVFTLGENWHGFDEVRAVFKSPYECRPAVLDSNGECYVPVEVLFYKGKVRVNLVGSIVTETEVTDRLTTYSVEALDVDEDVPICGEESQPISPSEYEQFVAKVANDANRASQSATDAETYADEAEASAQNASESASASAVSASDSARSATASAGYAQDASEIAVEVEVMKNEVELAKDKVLGMRATAETLEAGSDATASYSDGLLTLGIPRGDKGEQGIQGETGATPNLTIGTVETLAPTEDATATITGTAEEPVLNLGLTKGDKGDTGNGIASITHTGTSGAVKTYTITFTDGTSQTYDVTDGEVTTEQMNTAIDGAVTDLKSAINEIVHGENASLNFAWENGTINSSGQEALDDRAYYARTKGYYTPTENEKLIASFVANLDSAFVFVEFNSDNSLSSRTVYWKSNATDVANMQSLTLTYGKKYRFTYQAPSSETLNLASMDSYISLRIESALTKLSDKVNEVSNDVNALELVTAETENELTAITEPVYMKNICDNSDIESGFINYETGGVASSETYKHSGYIRIAKDVMYMYQGAGNRFAFYTLDKTYIENATNNITSFDGGTIRGFSDNLDKYYFKSPVNGFVRISTLDDGIVFIAIHSSSDNTSQIDINDTDSVYPFLAKGRETIYIKASDGIDSFYGKMVDAFERGNVDVYIGKGTYTYTNALVESIRAISKRGVPIGNGCRYYFDSGSYIVCEYTGSSAEDVVDLFCPFDTWRKSGDYELHNLHLVAKNVCYAIHDEAVGSPIPYRHIYKDCYIELDNSALGTSGNPISKCIGGGLGQFGEIIIEDCVFKGNNPSMDTHEMHEVSYHGASDSTFTDSHIVVTGCYFVLGTFRTDNVAENIEAPYPRVIYSNNSSKVASIIAPTWTKYEWNNVIHN